MFQVPGFLAPRAATWTDGGEATLDTAHPSSIRTEGATWNMEPGTWNMEPGTYFSSYCARYFLAVSWSASYSRTLFQAFRAWGTLPVFA